MMRPSRIANARERGSAAVEFALVFPLFVTILFGILEYGWIFYQQFNLASAVRDGLRQGVTVGQTSTPDPKAFAVQRALADLQVVGVSSSNVTLTTQYNGTTPTKTLTLTAVMAYHPLIGLVPVPAQIKYAMTMMLELQ
jgi:Flp pilus assembly protein TadG